MHSLQTRLPARLENGVTWHHIVSFNPNQSNYLKTLSKGSRVYVEANYELRDPDPNADPASPSGQRQIFLRHGVLLPSRRWFLLTGLQRVSGYSVRRTNMTRKPHQIKCDMTLIPLPACVSTS